MAALTLDIKTTNELEKSALATADALDKVAAKEAKVNSLIEKINSSSREMAIQAKITKESASPKDAKEALDKRKKAIEKAANSTVEKAEAKAARKREDLEKRNRDRKRETLAAIKAFPFALAGAVVGAVALGAAIGAMAKSAYDSKREATALLNAWTGQRAPQALKLIDGLASQLGMSFEEARKKFVQYREAGANNKVAAQLLKTRADLIAVGLSAEQADREISKVEATGRDIYGQARALSEIQRAYGGIGSGAKAAAFATISLSSAQAKISNVIAEKQSNLWERIGPAIGGAANRLADFAVKMLESEEAQAAIDGVVSAVIKLADAVNSENLTTGLNVVKALAVTVADVFEFTGKAIAFGAFKAVEAADWLTSKIGQAVDYLVDAFPDGAAIVDGLIDGITSRASAAVEAVVGLAKDIAGGFAETLGIKSPSRVFAEYGRNTVQGYEQGERRELASTSLPMQDMADSMASASPSGSAGRTVTASDGGRSIVIQNLIVQGGGNPDQIARSIRQELQLLLQAGDLSRGLT